MLGGGRVQLEEVRNGVLWGWKKGTYSLMHQVNPTRQS